MIEHEFEALLVSFTADEQAAMRRDIADGNSALAGTVEGMREMLAARFWNIGAYEIRANGSAAYVYGSKAVHARLTDGARVVACDSPEGVAAVLCGWKLNAATRCADYALRAGRPFRTCIRSRYFSGSFDFETMAEAVAYLDSQRRKGVGEDGATKDPSNGYPADTLQPRESFVQTLDGPVMLWELPAPHGFRPPAEGMRGLWTPVPSAPVLEFSPPVDSACQNSTVYVDALPVATLQRRRVSDTRGPVWRLFDLKGRQVASVYMGGPEGEDAAQLKAAKFAQGLLEAESADLVLTEGAKRAHAALEARREAYRGNSFEAAEALAGRVAGTDLTEAVSPEALAGREPFTSNRAELTDSEQDSVANFMDSAAAFFRDIAAKGGPRVAEQFETQAKQAEAFALQFRNADSVEIWTREYKAC